ncbi:MAG: hypothetical protein AABY22_34650 [Nanoarchaeota archaeon]
MAYKKYIKKDGKLYGPYVYHSRRENGQVITEYHGKNKGSRNWFLIIAGAIVLIAIVLFFYRFLTGNVISPTGRVLLDLDTDYRPNENLNGIARFSLIKGEFIPVDSDVVIDIAGEQYIYKLRDVVSETISQGGFYIEDTEITGSGEGFGEQGAKEFYPEVVFELEIFNSDTEIMPVTEGGGETTETPTEATGETTSETTTEIESATSIEPTTETTSETPTETTESSAETTSETTGETSGETSEEVAATGNFVRTISGLVVSADIVNSIEGKASFGSPYEFELEEGTSASIRSGSAKVNEEKVDDSYVSISIQDGKAVVITTYKEEERGYGAEYLNNEERISLNLDLSSLNLTAKDGVMKISLVYNGQEIAETSTNLNVLEEEIEEQNITEILNETETNVSADQTEIKTVNLTSSDRKILVENAGTDILKTTSAVVKNDRLLVRYELGKYWVEYSYNYNGEVSKDLEDKIDLERGKWLKNLALQLSKEKNSENSVSELLKNYNINEEKQQENITEAINQTEATNISS